MSRALAGKVAIVTGGASGIGRALSGELAARGCEVVVADRQVDLARTRTELEASGVVFQGRKKTKPASTRSAHLS